MRKLLLASAAVVGASVGLIGVASAQGLPGSPMQGTLPTRPSAGAYACDNLNCGAEMAPGPIAKPTPGSMVIRLGMRLDTDIGAGWSNLNSIGPNKLYPYGFFEYMRIYPGVDAMAANGLRYGSSVELRQNYTGTGNMNAALTAGGTAYTSTQTVYVRRAFLYLAGNEWGIVRFGETDGLIGTYDGGGQTTGVFLSPSGTIVGGNTQSAAVGNAWMIPYFAAQSGNEYGNTKLVYMSPSFYGFDVGLQYAPNAFNGYAIGGGGLPGNAGGGCGSAASGISCVNISSSPTPGIGSRGKDQLAIGARYSGPAGPGHLLAYGVYMTEGHVNYTGGAAAAQAALGAGMPAGGKYNGQFDNLNLGMVGANYTIAGISFFGNVMFGDYNGILAMKPQGGVGALGFGAGVKYAWGPYTIGGVYSQLDSQGAFNLAGISQRHENVVDVSATYTPAPGLTLYADWVYGTRHQGDYNFATGGLGGAYNNVTSQAIDFGTIVKW